MVSKNAGVARMLMQCGALLLYTFAGRAAPAAEGGEGVAAPSEVPMVTSVGPAGDFSGQAQVASAVEPANADVEVSVRVHVFVVTCLH